MNDKVQSLIRSAESRVIDVGDYSFSLEIYRLEDEPGWTLEVIDREGTSHIWGEEFKSDRDARNAAVKALKDEGPLAFMRSGESGGVI